MKVNELLSDFIPGSFSLRISSYEGVELKECVEIPMREVIMKENIAIKDSQWEVECSIAPKADKTGAYEGVAAFTILSGNLDNANVGIRIDFDDWSTSNYVMMPAAVYNGNRFRVIKKKYPPMLHKDDGIGIDMPITITDVPHLNDAHGTSKLHLRSGDMATPCVVIRASKQGKGLILLSDHNTPFGYTGFLLQENDDRTKAYLQLEAPAIRQTMYLWGKSDAPSDDEGYNFVAGDKIILRFNIYIFECPDISTLYKWYCNVREDISGKAQITHSLPFSAAFKIIEEKYLKTQWNEKQEYLMVAPYGSGIYGDWQAGWVGGGMNSLALMTDGMSLSRERARKTMDTIFSKLQAPNGYIYPIMYEGRLLGDDFDDTDNINVLLIRKNADILLFAARHIILLKRRFDYVPEKWIEGFKKLADAFVRLWNKYGQFGQFIDIAREEIIIGGTASGSTAPGGLALAWKLLGDIKYLNTAIESGKYFYEHHVSKGIINGGPGEILQGCDSESAFGLLESYVVLYEVTGEAMWLQMAEDCAHQCASWCVSYDFDFPKDSVFGKLGMRTAGSVYANVQNKHSAPGICTLSGASLLKLYRATGDELYLELCRQIAHNITQYLSREDRPILSWDGKYLPAGWMCERVNMSDWETKEKIGGVFYGSCWCEVSCLLTYSEIPGIWVLADTGEVITFDHVNAEIKDNGNKWLINIENPTDFDALIKVCIDARVNFDKAWGECALEGCPTLYIPAHKSIVYEVDKIV